MLRRPLWLLLPPILLVGLVRAGSLAAQPIAPPPLDRPIERPFEPEPALEEGRDPKPRLETPAEDSSSERSSGFESQSAEAGGAARIQVDAIRFRGNRAVSDATLQEAARPFIGRALAADDLRALVVALSRVYVDAGYVNSGATLPPQAVAGGELEIELVEGGLAEIEFQGLRHYRGRVLERRLRRSVGSPLRVQEIETALRLLERDDRIRRLDARVRPTDVRGLARLVVRVEESNPFWTEFGIDNHAPSSVGTFAGRVAAGHDNPFGFGDRFVAEAAITEGLWRLRFGYEMPVGPWGTTLGFETRLSDAEIVQPPFDRIDVESSAQSYAASLRHPLLRTLEHDLSIGLIGEHRRGRTSLLGRDEPLSAGSDAGRIRISLLRPFVEWTLRRPDYAVSLRSLFSFGLPAPTSTKSPAPIPDGRFFAWLGQARSVYRLPGSRIELHGRLDLQLSDDALLSLEQFALGGPGSVRGIPTNVLVRDQGLFASIEARIPLVTTSRGRRVVEAIPFADLGRAWNRDRVTPGKRTLSSVGLGLRLRPVEPMLVELQWAHPIRDVDRAGSSLQGRGFLLAARWRFR